MSKHTSYNQRPVASKRYKRQVIVQRTLTVIAAASVVVAVSFLMKQNRKLSEDFDSLYEAYQNNV